ncbi:MAG TPA: hypothetical protein VE869_01260 [Gemmatimonas sp.]|nr:hypothetical protein [Gemmatimonas sp.]
MADTALFRVQNVKYNTRGVPVRGAPDEQVRTGVRQAEATCGSCGHAWTAQAGVTGLRNTLGGVHLECPKCEARGTVNADAFE